MNARPPVTQLTVPDALAASAHGLTESEWRRLTDTERQWHRWNMPTAPNFQEGSR